MTPDICLYPYSPEGRELPVCLTGLGGTAYQQPVRRPEGYFWHQILLCLGGSGVLETEGRQQMIRAGDALFLPAGRPHAYWPDAEQWEVRWMTLDGSAMPALTAQLQLTGPQVFPGGAGELLPAFEAMLEAVGGDPLVWPYTCSAQAYSCLIGLHRLTSGRPEGRSAVLTQALRCMEEGFARDLSLTEIAGAAGVTPQHLCRVFRRELHMRPGEYLTQRRLQAAQTLLRESELPLADVAARVGFAGAGYFSTVFRRYVGVAPGEYRRQMRPD